MAVSYEPYLEGIFRPPPAAPMTLVKEYIHKYYHAYLVYSVRICAYPVRIHLRIRAYSRVFVCIFPRIFRYCVGIFGILRVFSVFCAYFGICAYFRYFAGIFGIFMRICGYPFAYLCVSICVFCAYFVRI